MGDRHPHTHLGASVPRLRAVLALLVAVLVAELVGGLVAGSVALLADAGHLLSDAAGVALALVAASFAARPATSGRTFGLQRAEILAAVVNGVLLLSVGLVVTGLAVWRFLDPQTSDAGLMAVLGSVALAANGCALLLLRGRSEHSLNVRGAHLEVLSDALGALGVLVAAALIATTGTRYADPAASLLVGLLIVPRTLRLLREAVDVLLEATPRGIDLDEVRRHLMEVDGVVGCHDLHAWTITSGTPVLSAHVVLSEDVWAAGEAPAALDRLTVCVTDHFGLDHATIQLEQSTHASHERTLHE
ncbi:MAG TPA: cation diffusion facilitator family transporter [Mycobacteriales bacterium]|nr:cation diffusion facilitator family transporter [Mycobacteriales bacterium]